MRKQTIKFLSILTLGIVLIGLSGCVSAPKVNLVPGENLVENGDFEAGQGRWSDWIDDGWGGDGEVLWDDGIATINIFEQGDECWAVAMHYKKILIEKGAKYTYSFRAKSDQERVLRIGIGSGLAPSDPPYLYYNDVVLGTEWETYEFDFKMLFRNDKFARLDFNAAHNIGAYLPEGVSWSADKLLATSGATVYIDDVELRKYVPEVLEVE